MKVSYLIILLIIGLMAAGLARMMFLRPATSENDMNSPGEMLKMSGEGGEKMQLTSSAFATSQEIDAKYTCDGENVNPPLEIAEVPGEAKSLVLIVDDPDAPVGDWVHWIVWNIAPETKEIAENSVPVGAVEGMTDFGKPGYGGPCPPSGTHRYQFKLYALDTKLDLDSSAGKAEIERAMAGHILEQAMLVGVYKRA